MQLVLPAFDTELAGQARQLLDRIRKVTREKVPLGQVVQIVNPNVGPYVPAPHAAQRELD